MKRFSKIPAIIGGIAAIITLISSLIGLFSSLSSGYFNFLNLLRPLSLVALAVALLRGKKDPFAGVCFSLNALQYLLLFVIALLNLRNPYSWKFAFYIGNFESIFLIAAFALMALDCFVEFKMPASTKILILVVCVAAHFLMDLFTYGLYLTTRTPGAMSMVFSTAVSSLPQLIVRLMAVLAVAKSTADPGSIPMPQRTGEFTQHPPQINWYGYLQPGDPGYDRYCGQPSPAQPAAPVRSGTAEEHGYIGLGKHIALSLLTFGIWNLIWIYKTTNTLNQAPGEAQQSGGAQLLLCLFIPFYTLFWFYKQGKRTESYSAAAGVPCSCAALCLVFAIICPLVSVIVLQDKINAAANALAG